MSASADGNLSGAAGRKDQKTKDEGTKGLPDHGTTGRVAKRAKEGKDEGTKGQEDDGATGLGVEGMC